MKCEASAMAYAIFEDEDIEVCNNPATKVHTNGEVTYHLCVPCHVALSAYLGEGNAVVAGKRELKFKVKVVRVSIAARVGECWLCGHGGRLWHKVTSLITKCPLYEPIREETCAEFERLSKKHGG